jgi:ribokinase
MIEVAVVGSLNLDMVVDAPRLPGRRETLFGSSWRYKCGGRGGNQAISAARSGARTAFGGQIGKDDFGDRLRANLAAARVDITHLDLDPLHGSGMSIAVNEASGDYGAVVVSGANLTINAQTIASRWDRLWHAKVLLLQNEIPEVVSRTAARLARENGGTIILNAAPARELTPGFLNLVDVLVVNRAEARVLSGADDPDRALAALHAPKRDVVITRGVDGLMLMTRKGVRVEIPALPVKLVSSHGAGDCFCGALAARLAAGDDIEFACRFATAAAGRFVSGQ